MRFGSQPLTWPLIRADGSMCFQPDNVPNCAVNIHNNPNAVNGVQLNGTIAGNKPGLQPIGADLNSGIFIAAKGSGTNIIGDGAFQNVIEAIGSGGVTRSWVQATAATSGNPVALGPASFDTNVGLNLVTKGTGPLLINGSAGTAGQVLTSNGAAAAPTWSPAAGGVAFPLTSAGDMGFQPDGVANNALLLTNAALAVNGIRVSGTAAGSSPALTPVGSDANPDMWLVAKGTGSIVTADSGSNRVIVASGAGGSPVNYVTVTNAITAVSPSIAASGGDTNVGLLLTPKGSGVVRVTANTVQVPAGQGMDTAAAGALNLGASSATSLVLGNVAATTAHTLNGTAAATWQFVTATTPALTVNGIASGVNGITISESITAVSPSIAASGSDTNIHLTLAAKGTGLVLTSSSFEVLTSGGNPLNAVADGTGNNLSMAVNTIAATYFSDSLAGDVALAAGPGTTTLRMGPGVARHSVLALASVTSAVNGMSLTAAATGNAPILAAIGSDTNLGLTLTPKGTGGVTISTGTLTLSGNTLASPGTFVVQPGGVANAALTATNAASAVNGIQVGGVPTANAAFVQSVGTDTNIGLQLFSKGTGQLDVIANSATGVVTLGGASSQGTSGRTPLTTVGVSGGVNGVSVTQAATGARPLIQASGSDTNVDLSIGGKGTGVINIFNATTQSTSPAAGGAGALPATPAGYLSMKIGAVGHLIPYY